MVGDGEGWVGGGNGLEWYRVWDFIMGGRMNGVGYNLVDLGRITCLSIEEGYFEVGMIGYEDPILRVFRFALSSSGNLA
jgi:hypothetical protein